MSGKPRLCIAIPSLCIGGTERQALYLVEGLSTDFDVRVLCIREEGPWGERARTYAEVSVIGIQSGWDPRAMLRSFAQFRRTRPDIVQTFLFGFDYYVNFAARRAGVPVVVSSRRERATWKKPRHIWLQRRANALVDGIVANSNAVAEFAAHQEGAPSYTVIYNAVDSDAPAGPGVDARLDLTVPKACPLIGMVANFSADKDHELFVAMAEGVRARRPDAHFVLIGDGPRRAAIQRLVIHSGLGDAFRFTGRRDALRPYYDAMDVVVLCSRTEGLPNVVLEAMACGRPIVAAAVGGVPELVSDGVTGRLIASRAPADFALAVLDMLRQPENAARIGRQAARYARERFSVAAMTDAYRRLYLQLLDAKRGAR